MNEQELRDFRNKFGIPISDEDVKDAPFYRPSDDSPEVRYLHQRRNELGGYVPRRSESAPPLKTPPEELFQEFYQGTGQRDMATTMAFVHLLSKLLKDDIIGRYIVPIVPDEARTFGMEALFRQVGIYSSLGQLYEPVDKESLLYYKEATDGQILEEGITEAGSMASFIAAGTSYVTHGINMIPFFIFYSMFGFQRIGDLIWAAGDVRAKGFLLGGTAGRTTLAGEGLQHQDGQSHLLAYPLSNLCAYDPTYAYELAVIIRDGIRRMYEEQENIFYYLTVMNEPYVMPAMPDGSRDGILKGMYKLQASDDDGAKDKVHLFGSGTILNEALKAKRILEDGWDLATDVYSVTSYKELYWDVMRAERFNLLNPDKSEKVPHIGQVLDGTSGVYVAASDYMRALPESISRYVPGEFLPLGTDGYGRSDSRDALRDFFEVDGRYIALAALRALARAGKVKPSVVTQAVKDLNINPDKRDPLSF